MITSNILQGFILLQAFETSPEYFLFWAEIYKVAFNILERNICEAYFQVCLAMQLKHSFLFFYLCYRYERIPSELLSLNHWALLATVIAGDILNSYLTTLENRQLQASINELATLCQKATEIFDSIPDGLIVLNKELNLLNSNKAAESFLQAGALKDYDLDCIEDGDGMRTNLAEKIKSAFDTIQEGDVRFGTTKIQERLFEWKGSLVQWDGEPAMTVLIRDVTTLIQLEQAKHEANMKNIMLRSVSHELRTPANALTNLLERTLKLRDLPVSAKTYIELAHDNVQHLLHVVNDLLDYSQFLHGSFRLSKRNFNVKQTLMSAFKPFEYMIKATGISATIHIDNNLPIRAFNDPNRICQVVMNLLSNATKFTRKGEIRLAAVRCSPYEMKVSVSDDGVGISFEQQTNLFRVFGKLKENESLNPQGCGLGLHISNLLAKQLGSTGILLKSDLGRGSTFSFNVSLQESLDSSICELDFDESISPPVTYKYSFTNSMFPSPARVLVVDDNYFNRDVCRSMLAELGETSDEANSGEDCIEMVMKRQHDPFALIILDFEMPGMSGLETASTLKALNESGRLKYMPQIIGHSAYSNEEVVNQFKESGAKAYLPKPCAFNEFSRTVRSLLNTA
eukprot:CAMPEP_0204906906 /NCGR_PEP_ID=MMETSP1397-20131031/6216_1 /ASSEMBLY_ACC=CAM_ASM_000891 /TAXON_ID=49980 /ORGANISM="Climacostomum Climacostomum virens, Strain Stock W-24" /LENGTH=624 /DNA_ID=CAMNT_0052075911 /DNA_START=176 /DNA_END=2050 /DNA_ORIENTATION=-